MTAQMCMTRIVGRVRQDCGVSVPAELPVELQPEMHYARRVASLKVLNAPWETENGIPTSHRGSPAHRHRHRHVHSLLAEFGDGQWCPCVYCGAPLDAETLTKDRIIPGSRGGRYTLDNLLPACAPCNVLRADRRLSAEEFLE